MTPHRPSLVALAQAGGILAYIAIFVSLLDSTRDWTPPMFWMGPAMFLMAFVTSALICSLIVFGYPARLFLEGERARAVRIVLWTAGWLAGFCVLIFVIARAMF